MSDLPFAIIQPPAALGVGPAARRLLPGLGLCAVLSLAAIGLGRGEADLAGRAWLEPLVLAILLGTALRTGWTPGVRWRAGIDFSARTVLEIAVMLLGATVSLPAVLAAGPRLLGGIVAVVIGAIFASYAIGRLLRLPHRLALLVACGNSICGNSAIAAVAPVIGADGRDVSAAIAFTAVLGVIVVLALPLTVGLLHLSVLQYGALAGLTVYAVPQVLAATAPIGTLAVQFGTLVKLMRVLMLGPVVLVLSLLTRRAGRTNGAAVPGLYRLVPWFIIGFLAMAVARAVGLIPLEAMTPIQTGTTLLTIISMAALGLGTDLRVVMRSGPRVTLAVSLSLLVLGGISLGLIHVLALG